MGLGVGPGVGLAVGLAVGLGVGLAVGLGVGIAEQFGLVPENVPLSPHVNVSAMPSKPKSHHAVQVPCHSMFVQLCEIFDPEGWSALQ